MKPVSIARTKDDVLQAIFLRRKVLVREFGFSRYQDEPDRYDYQATLYIVKDGKKVVGTVRVRPDEGVHRIQRVAILPDYRKKGIGSTLLKRVIQDFKKLYVMAPTETVPFYERFGFSKEGKTQQGKKHLYHRMKNY
jgi:N-acetylglutamate synthase-like GNAT family acetyltransferase